MNELTAILTLLRILVHTEATVAIGGIRCRPPIAAQIATHGADYVPAMKRNHPTLYIDIAPTFAIERAEAFSRTLPDVSTYLPAIEKNHGRRETRQHRALRNPALFAHRNLANVWTSLHDFCQIEGRCWRWPPSQPTAIVIS